MVKCNDCGSLMRDDTLKRHKGCCKIKCKVCGEKVAPLAMEEHKAVHEYNLRHSMSQSQSLASSLESEHTETEPELEQYGDIYRDYGRFISTFKRPGKIMDTHNFQVDKPTTTEFISRFKSVYQKQRNAFKVKISLGVILFNKTTEECAYYKSSQNNQLLFEQPTLIRNSSDKANFIRKLESTDILEAISRPNSQWTVSKVTNVTFYVFKLVGTPIGSSIELPPHLANNKGIQSLTKNWRGQPYKDNLCFFRCLSLHEGFPASGLEKDAIKKYPINHCKSLRIPGSWKRI